MEDSKRKVASMCCGVLQGMQVARSTDLGTLQHQLEGPAAQLRRAKTAAKPMSGLQQRLLVCVCVWFVMNPAQSLHFSLFSLRMTCLGTPCGADIWPDVQYVVCADKCDVPSRLLKLAVELQKLYRSVSFLSKPARRIC
jgi:hypothetical protein